MSFNLLISIYTVIKRLWHVCTLHTRLNLSAPPSLTDSILPLVHSLMGKFFFQLVRINFGPDLFIKDISISKLAKN